MTEILKIYKVTTHDDITTIFDYFETLGEAQKFRHNNSNKFIDIKSFMAVKHKGLYYRLGTKFNLTRTSSSDDIIKYKEINNIPKSYNKEIRTVLLDEYKEKISEKDKQKNNMIAGQYMKRDFENKMSLIKDKFNSISNSKDSDILNSLMIDSD